MAEQLIGPIKTNDGTTIAGVTLHPTEMKKLEEWKNAHPDEPLGDIADQIYTTDGDTLAEAIDKINEEIQKHHGPASPSIPSTIDDSFLENMLSGSGGYGSDTSTSSNGFAGIPIIFWFFLFLVLFMVWQSEPTTSGNKIAEAKVSKPATHRIV